MNDQEDDYIIQLNSDYINEIQDRYPHIQFKRIEKTAGLYITNTVNISFQNDFRIFRETQLKRYFNWTASHGTAQGLKKLQYFSKHETENDIYKLDTPKSLHIDEKYAIQNIGHATQLILLPNCTILTDPIFGQLFWLIYPEKTKSHPDINNLPRINVILISHNHRDHVDKKSLCKILSHHKDRDWPVPIVFVPMGDRKLFKSFGFKQIEEVDWFTKISVTKNNNTVNFVSIPADHRSGRSGLTDYQLLGLGSDHHRSLVIGWVINDEVRDVIFKYSGDTRLLSDENQSAVDAVLWNEIKNKKWNIRKANEDISLPDIICFEPSGPNYTRCDMDVFLLSIVLV